MSFDVGHDDQTYHCHSSARRHAPHGLIATIMPPSILDRISSRHECRQIIRVFLGGIGIGFALAGAAAWTANSTSPALQAKAPTKQAFLKHGPMEAATSHGLSAWSNPADQPTSDAIFPVASAPALSVEDAPLAARQPVQLPSQEASLQPYPLSAPEMNGAPALPAHHSRTAVYDIATHTVYMPNGQTLEAHSGLGRKLDDPRYVAVRNKGPTPPNVYDLALREKPFHKVRAIRLIPVGGNMFGRDGMLAHSYMRGDSGESNGCVSFKDYSAFLRAFLDGAVDRLVVVSSISKATWHTASAATGSQYLDTN